MKKFKYILAASAVALILAPSCNSVMEEQPRTFFEPGYFQTQNGVEGGLTALYASLRYLYGQAYYYNSMTTGTDEATYGQSADGNFKDADLSGVGDLNASTARTDVLWGTVFTYINTANGIIENATKVGLDNALIAEAQFFRGFYYFQLVQTFGGVPLDLGSGRLAFNSTPSRTSVRNTVPEVYQAIFQDLNDAVKNLPDKPRLTGTVTKNVARLVLAKAYLTFGWWLDADNTIATYPLCEKKDLDGHDNSWYFKQSLDLCSEGIKNPGPYGLCDTYWEVNVAKNDRNKEIMLYADHTEASELYNGGSLTYGSGGAPDNFAGWMMNWNHGTLNINGVGLVVREASQEVGRPWTRMAPTHEAIAVFTEEDITKDSRFDGTFTTMYYGTWNKSGNTAAEVTGANGMSIPLKGRVLSFIPEVLNDITYPDVQSNTNGANVGAGTVPGRADYVFDLNGISRIAYPALWKLGCYRTDYDTASQTGSPNAGSTRPYSVLKYSDFYLTGAEAALRANEKAKCIEYLNEIRQRAGKWKYKNNERREYNASFENDMKIKDESKVDINFILDERMREYYGEGFRWFDLARTRTWAKRAGKYTISDAAWGSHTPKTYTRTIEDYRYLFPIPQGQLDGMEMTDEEKAAYQNPGYTVN